MNKIKLILGASILLLSAQVSAALINNGNGLIYDSILDITWLQDANYAVSNDFGVSGVDTDGRMTWGVAQNWITAMNGSSHLGFTGWRLPSVTPADGVKFDYVGALDGSTDRGYNVGATGTENAGSTGSEMVYLFNSLGNTGRYDIDGTLRNCPNADCMVNTGPFINIQTPFAGDPPYYWSDTVDARYPNDLAWVFNFNRGNQGTNQYSGNDQFYYAWAVHDGELTVSPVPAPPALLLFLTGIIGLGFARRKRQPGIPRTN